MVESFTKKEYAHSNTHTYCSLLCISNKEDMEEYGSISMQTMEGSMCQY